MQKRKWRSKSAKKISRTDIRHVSGEDNVVADMLSRIESVQSVLDYTALKKAQDTDDELQNYMSGRVTSSLDLKKFNVPGSIELIICDHG